MLFSISRVSPYSEAFRGVVTAGMLVALAVPANAGDILRGGAAASTARTRTNSGASAGADVAAQTQANAKDRLARTTQALNAMKGLQAQARAAAAGNVKLNNPNKPGQFLPTVRNGLGKGGLQVDPLVPKNLKKPKAGENPSLWVGANLPKQTTGKDGGKDVTIVQTDQQALLTWKTFNVGKKTTLTFDQSAGKDNKSEWIAFNKVNDPSGRPSQILGSIKADGQVYVINQNGIIFGGSSQVNVHTLVASSLPINTNLIANGLLNNPDAQFLFCALALPAGAKGTPAFTPPAPLSPNGTIGDVVVEKGAQLESPTSAAHVGGRIMLVGPNVENKGTISTPDGQTILAAGLQVGVAAHSSDDPGIRGLDVYIGATGNSTARVVNAGLVETPRGNVTMAGKNVRQLGVIDSTTTVSLNGSIRLSADYNAISNPAYDPKVPSNGAQFLYQSTGVVTLGENSTSRILPELTTDTATGVELALRSRIDIEGLAVHLDKNSVLLAPNATADIRAGAWHFTPSDSRPLSAFVYSAGQIYVDTGAVLDVSGTTDVFVPQADSILTLQLRGSELADSPLQRDSVLRAVDLTIDARITGTFNGRDWVGTPLGDASGFLDIIQRTVGQLTADGGSISLQAGNSVVLQSGALLDVSGGWMNNGGGLVKTTRVISGSQLIDIADATPDRVYDGIYDPKFTTSGHAKWGISQTFANPLALTGAHFESDYVSGANAGSIAITAPSMALDGKLAGRTVIGPHQLRKNAVTSTLPDAGKLALTFRGQDPDPAVGPPDSQFSPYPPRMVFTDALNATPVRAFTVGAGRSPLVQADGGIGGIVNPFVLPKGRRATVALSPALLTDDGFGSLSIDNSAGDIVVPRGVSLDAPAEGTLTFQAANINVQGTISAPGGELNFTSYNISPYLVAALKATSGSVTPESDPDSGRFVLGPGARISTAGLVVDERTDGATTPLVTGGGAISITAYTARLAEGSVLDVSGGGQMTALGAWAPDGAGAISIKAGQDANLPSVLGGRLRLDGELRGYSGAKGGTLAIQAPFVQVGGTQPTIRDTFWATPDFFNRGGFTKFALAGIGAKAKGSDREFLPGLVIAADTVLAPRALGLELQPLAQNGGRLVFSPTLLPAEQRAPVSLSFAATGATDALTSTMIVRGDLVMEDGAFIRTDPEASVSFTGDTVSILGSVRAPGGEIAIKGGTNSKRLFNEPDGQEVPMPTVYIGPESRLSTAGTTVLVPDPYGRRIGSVLPGGDITVSGNLVASAGAVLDVSGASDVLDLPPLALDTAATLAIPVTSGVTTPLAKFRTVPTRVDSDAGTITLTGGEELFTDATLLGRAGGPTALGGTLSVTSGRFYTSDEVAKPLDPTLIVTQGGSSIPQAPFTSVFAPGDPLGVGKPLRNVGGQLLTGIGRFAVEDFEAGGFDSLTLGGNVRFKGAVIIAARGSLKVATGGVLYADDAVDLTASYVALGQAFRAPRLPGEADPPFTLAGEAFHFAPRSGPGRLDVHAHLIDIGTLSLQGIHRATFTAMDGDVRGAGTLDIAGDLVFRAGQIYTPTALSFSIFAYDHDGKPGSVKIFQAGSRPLPLSAGGTLGVYASVIEQGGTLRAPFGTINLGWDGTGDAPVDAVSGRAIPVTKRLVLGAHSVTSVSAVDPATGEGLLIPYGVSFDGNSWIDPSGTDITAGGLPTKNITLAGQHITTKAGSQIDLRGGGDLYAYRWVAGNGGSTDILDSTTSFAVLPGYADDFAPVGAFNDSTLATNLQSDPADASTRDAGYTNSHLSVGDRIHLGASSGLPDGDYTLLPARYALLPGAFLVTPKPGAARGTLALPDGSSLASGYRFNDLNSSRQVAGIGSRYEVISSEIVRERAQYDDFFANAFLAESARSLNLPTPLLPKDSGHLVFQATDSMKLRGDVSGKSIDDGRGAYIDVSSASDIVIADGRAARRADKDKLVLSAALLDSWGAESLLIGGVRETGEDGTSIRVTTGNLSVVNAGVALSAPEIILVANDSLTLGRRAQIVQTGALTTPAQRLTLTGDGALLRVSSDANAETARTGVDSGTANASVKIGAGARIAGVSIALDSTHATDLSARAILDGQAISLSSGQISLRLSSPGTDMQATEGLVLAGRALRSLENADSLSLLSYSSIDIYGSGDFGSRALENLELHAGEIRGFHTGKGAAAFQASHILLDNAAGASAPGSVEPPAGALAFRGGVIELGDRRLRIDQYAKLSLNASREIFASGKGRLITQGDLTARTPLVTGASGAKFALVAAGDVKMLAGKRTAPANADAGLGASLEVRGASVTADSDILLPSGLLTLRATSGDVNVGGRLDVGGASRAFNDLVKYTDGGAITLQADAGDVKLGKGSVVSVAAQKGGGSAGSLNVSAAAGEVAFDGRLFAQGGAKGRGGNFSLDVGSLDELGSLSAVLRAASFNESQSFRVRNGDVLINGTAASHDFALSADHGSIRVTGTIDASGATGGTVALAASGSVVLADGALIDASGKKFSNAGKGGAITLEAGDQVDGVIDPTALLDIQAGSKINLSVAANTESSADLGRFTGTLHLRAPQNAAGTDLQMAALEGTITDASSIIVEGYKLYDLTGTSGSLTGTSAASTLGSLKNKVKANGDTFVGAAGTESATYGAMHDRLLANNAALDSVLTIRPGAEIINRAGDITLGSASTTASNDWDFQTYRFGTKSAPGILTMRASGNLVFNNSLHDGFAIPLTGSPTTANTNAFRAPLMAYNPLLPANAQSWSYRLSAGADFGAADFHRVRALSQLSADSGSLLIGKTIPFGSLTGGSGSTVQAIINANGAFSRYYQVIRTGSGDIDISAGRDVQLLSQLASIYTAGTLVKDPTLGGKFDLPNFDVFGGTGGGSLGVSQQEPAYPAQYTLGGGNVSIRAQNDIAHYTRDAAGNLIADSERQLPTSWLYRRGAVDAATGEFGTGVARQNSDADVESTSWWVDFSNFFEGVATLGGGDVTLVAGRDVSNVGAAVATNARMPKGRPDVSGLVELGGGDLMVRAGHNIDAGVYYVERGAGVLSAGNDITTNATRSASLINILSDQTPLAAQTWLPTTLFLGKGGFDVSARGNVLLGPVANPFLLPAGIGNGYFYKTYFSTYAPTSSVEVASLGGDVTLRESATQNALDGGQAAPLLQTWLQNQLLLTPDGSAQKSASYYQPWLRLDETSVDAFATAVTLLPGTLRATTFAGDVNLVGNLTLSPAPRGTLEIASAGSLNGLQPNGVVTVNGNSLVSWGASVINVSDAAPGALPGIASPFAYQSVVGTSRAALRVSGSDFLSFIEAAFRETGATDSVLETKQALHAPGLLHRDDPNPIRLYAQSGDISGLTLFSPKAARVIAGEDITDIALYMQNLDTEDVSVVSAGRDLIASNASSALRASGQAGGNILNLDAVPQAGDIQISGPGTVEVLAGHNLDLGTGTGNADGTGTGITTIGNARNPYLGLEGASVIGGAGIGPSAGLTDSALDFDKFIETFLDGAAGEKYLAEIDPKLEGKSFADLPAAQRNRLALEAFYRVLRDAGRAHAAGTGDYDTGYAAIAALFPDADIEGGNIATRSRDIRTKSGGDISLFAPGGKLTLATSTIGSPLAPPGIITESGGNVSIFTDGSVNIGIGRIFTLRGGNEIIWSSVGDIAAGASSKTVKSAPPTRVLLDPQSADVKTDLAGLATGGGIGVLATVAGVPPGDVDLIAPAGVVDAGDAGIRSTGTVTIAATKVLNADNISATTTVGVPPSAPPPAAPPPAPPASNSTAATNNAANEIASQARQQAAPDEAPSVFDVEVVGYGGSDDSAQL
jgi:filamentous hemagglutinin family protein